MKTISRVRVIVRHPRAPQPSYAEITAWPDWLQGNTLLAGRLTEDECVELAKSALDAAVILGKLRRERAS